MAAHQSDGLHRPEIVLVRHGETEWTISGRHTSRTDILLTERGCHQAEQVATRIEGRKFGVVLTSPLQRAVQTCRLAGFGDAAEPSADLVEWDYGSYEGRTTAEIRAEVPDWSLWAAVSPAVRLRRRWRVGPIV